MGKKNIKWTVIVIAIVIVAVVLLSLNNQDSGTDMGFYYPNSSDLSYYESFPIDDVEYCRDFAYSMAEIQQKRNGEWDYECGFGCEFNSDFDLYICNETIQ